MKKSKAKNAPVEINGAKSKINEPIANIPQKVQIILLYDSSNPLHRQSAAAFTTAQGKPNRKEIRRFIDSQIAASRKVK